MISGLDVGAVLGAYQQVHSGGGGSVGATATFNFNDTLVPVVVGLSATSLSLAGISSGYEGPGGGDKIISVGSINSTSSAAAFTNGEYLETTITGSGLTITNIAYKGAGGGSSTRGLALRTDNDSYATEVWVDLFSTVDPTFVDYSHDVNIPVGAGRVLRFYTYAPTTGATLKLNDLIITASE